MAKMKTMIDYIIGQKSNGNSFQEMNYTMRLMLKGIPVKTITDATPDDPQILSKIYEAAEELNVLIPNSIINEK